MTVADPRHISNGRLIPSEGYADQPYVVQTDDGAWLLAVTTGPGREGARGQHVISMRSTDRGATWTDIADVEPSDGPEASYAVLLKTPFGRVYCFYNHNTDNVREVKAEDRPFYSRVDSLGHYVFKFSDDHGRTWSPRRYDVPVHEFACDRENVYGGRLRFFWNVGRPLLLKDGALLVLHKVGAMGAGFFAQSEGAFLFSANILTERDPERVAFITLPDGDIGLRTPPGGGRVAEEQSVTVLSDGTLYCVYRTIDGWPACAYSRDGGHTWTPPAYKTYTPGGRRVKHPRAANFVWRCANGRHLYWFHNHGGAAARSRQGWDYYDGRNPVWLMAGREVATPDGLRLAWSQPEILLYDDDPLVRMSYPDLIEEDGKCFVTETQKTIGRVHAIAPDLLAGLFAQGETRTVTAKDLTLELVGAGSIPPVVPMPRLPQFVVRDHKSKAMGSLDARAGFSIELWLQLDSLRPGDIILDSRTPEGIGLALTVSESAAVRLTLSDGQTQATWDTDPGTVRTGALQHLVATVDGGPKIITFLVDGALCDGGDEREYGWGRYSPHLLHANGAPNLLLAPRLSGRIHALRLYARALCTSEAVGNHRAGPTAKLGT